jgi:DNA-binding NtrC family response regulator
MTDCTESADDAASTPEPITVLCVDDDPQQVELLAVYLDRADALEVSTATGAREALETVREGGVDCVVSDFDMPEMNGIELLDAVRDLQAGLPFVLHTSYERRSLPADIGSFRNVEYSHKSADSGHFEVLADAVKRLVADR